MGIKIITRNQIDQLLIDVKHGSNVTDGRSLRCMDADSDHFMGRAKVRL